MIKVCLLSYNRLNLLKKTIASLNNTGVKFDLTIVDASTDKETIAYLATRQDVVYLPKSNVGQAMNYASSLIKQSNFDYGLITADDYIFNPFWAEILLNFWSQALDQIKLCACNFEPDYQWNTTEELYIYGNQQYAFIRNSLPGSNWSFRKSDIDKIFPVAEKTGGEDLETCNKLKQLGFKLAALDLTDHLGEKVSAWGNNSYKMAEKLTRLELLQKHGFINEF